jgi:hypothetical protein
MKKFKNWYLSLYPRWLGISMAKKKLRNGMVYKTHDYPPVETFNNEVKMLYILLILLM